MNIIPFNQLSEKLKAIALKLYSTSFPQAEQRKYFDHERACKDPNFHPLTAWNGESLVGILFYWEWQKYRYIEHISINPEIRNQGYGQKLLNYIISPKHLIILEIDTITDEISASRLRFYEKTGFILSPFIFTPLPYQQGVELPQMLILSYPSAIIESQFEDFKHYLNTHIIRYCENY